MIWDNSSTLNLKNRGKSFVNILNIVSRMEQVKFEEQSRDRGVVEEITSSDVRADDKWNFTRCWMARGAPFASG
jgi:hypothetical protein